MRVPVRPSDRDMSFPAGQVIKAPYVKLYSMIKSQTSATSDEELSEVNRPGYRAAVPPLDVS